MLNTQNKERYEALFEKLVPGSGKCETLGGEILRAVSRIGYRWYNDGDKFLEGYGRETVNPAVRFLIHVIEKHDVTEWFKGNLANCVIAVNMAMRMNADPLMVMQNMYIVYGNPSFSSKFLIACFNNTGRYSSLRYDMTGKP